MKWSAVLFLKVVISPLIQLLNSASMENTNFIYFLNFTNVRFLKAIIGMIIGNVQAQGCSEL